MRRWWSIIRATALEMSSEPLALMLTLGAVVVVALSSALHFHQFGEPSRMARDAGLSALLVFGFLYSVFCTIKVFRREIESGTLQMALSHPISRSGFFLAKVLGSLLAYGVFALTLSGVVRMFVIGAETGYWNSYVKGDIALIWMPAVYTAAGVVLVPLLVGAALDRFAHCRFTTTATWTALVCSWCGCGLIGHLAPAKIAVLAEQYPLVAEADVFGSAGRLVPALAAIALTAPVYSLAAAAFAVKFKDHVAASLSGVVFLLSVPALSGYYLSDALAKGGTVSWWYVAAAGAATLPFLVAFAVLGLMFFKDRDVG